MNRIARASGGRTPLFRRMQKILTRARFVATHPELGGLAGELTSAMRERGFDRSRREFLKEAGRWGIALPLLGAAGRFPFIQDQDATTKPASKDPIAIIGGGAAGLTAAYRLMKAGIPCEIFDAADRTGGRMYTKYDFNKEGMFCELGGELVDSNHADLIALAAELGLEIQELKGGDNASELFFFGGKVWSDKELLEAFGALAKHLVVDQDGLVDKDEAWTDKARTCDQMSVREYLQSKKDVDPTLIKILDVAYTIEYGREASEQSSLNFLTYIKAENPGGFEMFGESDESKRVKGGNEKVVIALAKAIEGKVAIHKGHRLTKISDDGKQFSLVFAGKGGGSKTVKFARAVSAIPFTMLREVEGVDALEMSPEKKACIKSLGYGTNAKVMYGFTDRHWRDAKATGRPECNGSLYNDMVSQCFWETSRGQAGKSGILTNFVGGKSGTLKFDAARFDSTLSELDQAIPGSKAKHDGNKAAWIWPTYELTKGSYTCPLVGQWTSILEVVSDSEISDRLLFAGEHTSADFSGFMNGAIESGNRVAKLVTG
jgi:monoamine oxidase